MTINSKFRQNPDSSRVVARVRGARRKVARLLPVAPVARFDRGVFATMHNPGWSGPTVAGRPGKVGEECRLLSNGWRHQWNEAA